VTDLNERLISYNKRMFFGQWRLNGATPDDALLGKGSFGQVYSVFREEKDSSGRLIRYSAAIKVIPIDEVHLKIPRDKTKEQRQQMLRHELRYVQKEIELMRRLEGESNIAYFQNSQIIRRTDTELECWDVLICMEKLIVLGQHLRQTAQVPGTHGYLMQTLFIWKELCAALSVCEKSAILHADIKPENVFYAPGPGHYKLSDFGASIDGKTFRPGIRYGTSDYMSPEMYYKKGGDSRTDMYSLAIMIYELFNDNQLPFQIGIEREAAWRMRLESLRPIPPLKKLPDDVNSVLLRCLEIDPARRYERCSDVADIVTGLYLKYKQGTAKLPGKDNKWIVVTAAGVLVVAGLAIGIGLMSGGGSSNQPGEAQSTGSGYVQQETAVKMYLDPEMSFKPGELLVIEGMFYVDRGTVDLSALCLVVDGVEWDIPEVKKEKGGYGFRSEGAVNSAGSKRIILRDREKGLDLAEEEIIFFVQGSVTPTPAPATPTPEPTPTPAPTPEPPVLHLTLDNEYIMAQTGRIEIAGSVAVTGGSVSVEELVLSVKGIPIDAQWTQSEEGCHFTAALDMDLEGMEALEIRLHSSANEAIRRVSAAVEVRANAQNDQPEQRQIRPITLEGEYRWLASGEALKIVGQADPSMDIGLQINDGRINYFSTEQDGSFEIEWTTPYWHAGQNRVMLTYGEQSSRAQETELQFNIWFDDAAPVLELPGEINQYVETLNIGVTDMDENVSVELYVDGQKVASGIRQEGYGAEGQKYFVTIPGMDKLELTGASQIEIRAVDGAGNASEGRIAFRRSLNGLSVNNEAELSRQLGLADQANGVCLEGVADPNVVLRISCGGRQYRVATESSGAYRWDVDFGVLQEGSNPVVIEYLEVDGLPVEAGTGRKELSLFYDATVPVVQAAPARLYQGMKKIELTVQDQSAVWVLDVFIDGLAAERGLRIENQQTYTYILPPKTVQAGSDSRIELRVTDAAGNTAAAEVEYIQVEKIQITDMVPDEPIKHTGVLHEVRFRPGARVEIWVDGDMKGMFTNDRGIYSVDLTEWMSEGKNQIAYRYAESNGYPAGIVQSTSASVEAEYDSNAPKVALYPAVITAVTEEIRIVTEGEAYYGYQVTLQADGTEMWRSEMLTAAECIVPIDAQWNLSADRKIEAVVIDAAGNETRQEVVFVEINPIVIENAADYAGGLPLKTVPRLQVKGADTALIDIWVNGKKLDIKNRTGSFKVSMAGKFEDGRNTVRLAYSEENPEEAGYTAALREQTAVELVINYDSTNPELMLHNKVLTYESEEIAFTVDNEPEGYRVQLLVDNETVWTSGEKLLTDRGCTIPVSPDEWKLTESRKVELIVTDAAGNETRNTLPYVEIAAIAVQANFTDVIPAGVNPTLKVNGEPGSWIDINVNDEQVKQVYVDSGSVEIELGSVIRSKGDLVIVASYSSSGNSKEYGYTHNTREKTAARIRAFYDPDMPQVELSSRMLMADIKEFTVTTRNEQNGYYIQVYVRGEEVWKSKKLTDAVAMVPVSEKWALKNGEVVELVVTDMAGNQTQTDLKCVQIDPIVITNAADFAPIVGQKVPELNIQAMPDAQLTIWLNGKEIPVQAKGSCRIDLTRYISERINTVRLEYSDANPESEGYTAQIRELSAVAMEFTRDVEEPEVSLSTSVLTEDIKQIDINVWNEADGYIVRFLVANKEVWASEMLYDKKCTLKFSEAWGLGENMRLAVVVEDAAGNQTKKSLTYKALDPIIITNASEFEGVAGTQTIRMLKVTGEPGASITVRVNGTIVGSMSEISTGNFICNLSDSLKEGRNTVRLTYSISNSQREIYTDAAIKRTMTEIEVTYDSEPPKTEIVLPEGCITRDTEQIAVNVHNEPHGYTIEMRVNDKKVWESGPINVAGAIISNIQEMKLKENDRIVIVIDDQRNKPVEHVLTYRNTSIYAQAYAFVEKNPSSSVEPGGTASIQAWLLCGDYDMQYAKIRLAGKDGSSITAGMVRRDPISMAAFDRTILEPLDMRYVTKVHEITGIKIPQNCPVGEYTVMISVTTEANESYEYDLGSVVVTQSSKGTQIGAPYVDAANRYAIGFDEPMQQTFCSDSIVLTGWVIYPKNMIAYFDRYELSDAYGDGEGYSRFVEYEREGAFMVSELEGKDMIQRGFVLRIDPETMYWENGGEYSFTLYSSNDMGTAWETLNAMLLIDENAAPITMERIGQVTGITSRATLEEIFD